MKKFIITTYLLTFLIGRADSPYTLYDKIIFEGTKNFAHIASLVQQKYVQDINPEEPLKKALGAFIQALDPHSSFLDNEAYTEILRSTKGELCGLGIIVDHTKKESDDFICILDILPLSPAEKAGLLCFDKIIAIKEGSNEAEECAVKGMTIEEAISKIQGKPKTKVILKIKRTGEPEMLEIEAERNIVEEPHALCYKFPDHNTYYIPFSLFTENSIHQLETILKKIKQNPCRALILDLRNNSGGLLNAVIDILGLFIGKNQLVVSTKGKNHNDIEHYYTKNDAINFQQHMPIFILVNNYTASAAEILAGCLQSYAQAPQEKRPLTAFVVGTKTFGKGSVQEIIPLFNDIALKLTTRLYYLPNETLIQGIGITPDFLIEQKVPVSAEIAWFNKIFGREESLKNTIKVDPISKKPLPRESNKEKNTEKKKAAPEEPESWHKKKMKAISTDYTILNTLRLLEIFHMVQQAYKDKAKTRKDMVDLINRLFIFEDKARVEHIPI